MPAQFEPDPHGHTPVLMNAVLDALVPPLQAQARQTGHAVVFDATLGRGGHAEALLRSVPLRAYVATDLDADNLAYARRRLEPIARRRGVALHLHHGPFTDAPDALKNADFGPPGAFLADLGFASNQIDDPARGFAFHADGPLDMRLDPAADTPTAADLVNTLPTDELADLIFAFGEDRLSRRIARKIVEARAESPILTTAQLAQIVRGAYPRPRPRKGGKTPRTKHGGRIKPGHRIDPATRTFQALRIAVNGELDALDTLLEQLPTLMAGNDVSTVAALISFHSLEDRRVKHAFLDYQRQELGQRVTRKPIVADEEEAARNPRARSAKLRVFRFQNPEP
ncbi:MAG: 16S rRNA (cytosine(1402)-N(4))-methyltransferase RsmH [Planctomycetota bacterium]